MSLFSIDSIDESILNEMQLDVKTHISSDKQLFQQQKIYKYKAFVKDLRSELEISKRSKQELGCLLFVCLEVKGHTHANLTGFASHHPWSSFRNL